MTIPLQADSIHDPLDARNRRANPNSSKIILLAMPVRFALLLCALGTFANIGRCEAQEEILKLGTRTFTTTQKTPAGIPVIPMWKAQMPTGNQSMAAGFPILAEAQHFDVWKPADKREGAFNHYAALTFHNGLFYAMWGNHIHGENCPGQRVLFSTSKDARSWSQPGVLFPPTGPLLPKDGKGMYQVPDRWVVADGKLYAVSYVFPRAGIGSYPIAREVAGGGRLPGEPVLLQELPANIRRPEFMPAPVHDLALAEKIRRWYVENNMVCWWAYHSSKSKISWWTRPDGKGIPLNGAGNTRIIESFSFRSKKGMVVLARDYNSFIKPRGARTSSNRIFASFPDGKGGWTPPHPTDIPDSHSRAQALTLPDGRVLLVGNQIAPRFDQGIYLVRDPLTITVSPDGETFTHVYALRSGGGNRPKHRFKGITGSGPAGYGYPSVLVHDGKIYVLYSINKEDMAVSIVPLASIK